MLLKKKYLTLTENIYSKDIFLFKDKCFTLTENINSEDTWFDYNK